MLYSGLCEWRALVLIHAAAKTGMAAICSVLRARLSLQMDVSLPGAASRQMQ